ncbi:RB1-inducible coiled-coil protein 1 [Camponotus floridanus]|uniref:RB1-inducible coiled-coil protein 1 n=1 Tax=Camponotus floridanus TaxID=104421 RepID=E2AF03_CAMFO|nr:RB1-inducible coiled-coil protein 1 isoform X1 [Camponotus floridanus]EFN67958.1 RB1-inducible coiled-coil protein 1 [Camponotus floridanus]
MLYIFHVDTGTTITFDIKLALESVSQLMEAIERECGVVATHQVLLMSGGECLEPNARVCSYSAGTDTNPIYLFSKAAIESSLPPTPSIDYGSDVDLQTQIDASLAMPATYQTLCARAHLAQQCCGLAREQTRICEKLVHDQHLQQQGWAAVVANLEDITQMFQSRAEQFQQAFVLYLAERQQHTDLLDNFSADLGTLAKIPILPALRAQAEGLLSPDDQPSQSSEPASENPGEMLSLLRWISAKDNQSSLEQVADQCSRGLEQFDERLMEALKAEVNAAIDNANKQDMKEIKGLGERLFALEQLMVQTKRLVHEQGELAQGFLQNQNRASNLGDASVLPDLCTSHRRQLLVMLQNHNQLRDIRRRCTKAKEELSVNIYHRLKWIMYVENKMVEVGNKLIIYHESLKRLRRHLEVLQQIHLAPEMYISAVIEVVRRRTFSQAFLVWASNLACQLLTVHSEELARRREFQSKFNGHFLNTLFPGLEDTPPPFATQAPSVFDNGLPKLTADDMESLRSQLPDLALTISTPDLNNITHFFLSKSFTEGSSDDIKGKDATSVSIPAKEQERGRAPMLSDRGDFESETDTEEFEKIGQAGADATKPGVFESAKQKRQKQLEVGASRSVSPASSTSTNVSPLNSKVADLTTRSSTSSEPGSFQFPSLSAVSERPVQLSPLTECVENGAVDSSVCLFRNGASGFSNYRDALPLEEQHSLSPNPSSLPRSSVMCDDQQHHYHHPLSGSGGSSPSVGVGATDFMGTEFYMDESLPSSLSEHPADGQHQAIMSLLQENLGNTREEVERLQSILKTMKIVVCEELNFVRKELTSLRERSNKDKSGFAEMTERMRVALSLYSRECDRRLQEREQELTLEHEFEITDVKKLIQSHEEEICTLKHNLLEKETELTEHERLVATMRQKLEDEQIERGNLQTRLHQQLEDYSRILEQARIDKEEAMKKANDEKFLEITSLTNSLTQCQKRIQELEENLITARNDQERIMKEVTDKFQIEYKTELETIRSRFKLMAASTMERSPSDSSLERIERTDVIELANHEAILEQAKEDMKVENAMAVRTAIEKERADCMTKLDNELKLAKEVVEEKNREIEMYRVRTVALIEQGKRYKNMMDRLIGEFGLTSDIQQTIKEKVKNLETDKTWLENKETAEKTMQTVMEQNKDTLYPLESEACKDLTYNRLDGSQVDLEKVFKDLESEKYEDEVSESKKVRLEANDDDLAHLSRRLEILENDNKRLSCELSSIRASKMVVEAKVEALMTDKIRLEIELLKERAKRLFSIDSSLLPSENRDRDMNASVAVVSDSNSSRDAATSPEPSRRSSSKSICFHPSLPSYIHKKVAEKVAKMVQQGIVTITSCNPGDVVLVVWDTVHGNYAVYQESSTLYFLHSDYVDALDAGMNSSGSRKCILAEVIDKEYCHARKHENRYHVPRGTKFYRVRAKPRDVRALTEETGSLSKSQLP